MKDIKKINRSESKVGKAGMRLMSGILAGVLLCTASCVPVQAASWNGTSDTVTSVLNGDGEEILDNETKGTQRAYIREALNELREIGITPDVVLDEMKILVLSLIHSGSDEDDVSGDAVYDSRDTTDEGIAADEGDTADSGNTAGSGNEIAAEEPIPETAAGTLSETAEQVSEDAAEYVSGKVDEAKEQVKETAKEKATDAVESFFDSLFK